MSNDVLIAIPLFVFMGYLVERAALIDRLFKSLHLATGARARLARGRDDRHLRDLRHRDRHRRRGGDADGPARVSGDAASAGYNIKVSAGRDHRRRLPRHPDPALGAADRLRRDRGRVGRPALRRRVLPRLHARRRCTSATSSCSPSGKPSLMPPLPQSERAVPLPPLAQIAGAAAGATRWSGSARARSAAAPGVRSDGVAAQLFVTLLPALVIARRCSASPIGWRPRRWSWRARRRPRRGGRRDRAPDARRRRPGLVGEPAGGKRPELAEPPAEEAKDGAAAAPRPKTEAAKPPPQPAGRATAAAKAAEAARRARAPAGADLVLDRARDRHRRHSSSSTGCGAGSGSRSSRCCSPRSSRWRC